MGITIRKNPNPRLFSPVFQVIISSSEPDQVQPPASYRRISRLLPPPPPSPSAPDGLHPSLRPRLHSSSPHYHSFYVILLHLRRSASPPPRDPSSITPSASFFPTIVVIPAQIEVAAVIFPA
ncbi:hypothetical protein ACLOJK_004011 [Asimina triloba]